MSEQSPWGAPNNNNNKNPDDVLGEALNKLKQMFFNPSSKNRGNGKSGGGKPTGFKPMATFILIGFALIVLYNSFYQIQPGEQGVVTQFGAYVNTSEPGLNFLIPFVEKIDVVNVDIIRKEEFGFVSSATTTYSGRESYTNEISLMLTGDKNVINLNWVVQYRISSPKNYLFNVEDPRGTVRDVSETVIRRHVGNRDFDYLLNNREELAFATKTEMQIFLDKYKSGIALEAVQLLDVTPPETVRPSFNEVNEADQDKTRLVNEAQREYNEKIPKAKGQAKQLLEESEGYRIRRVNVAKGEAARFNSLYQEYRQYPEVTKTRIYIETMRKILPTVNEIIIIDQNKNIIPLLNLTGNAKGILNSP